MEHSTIHDILMLILGGFATYGFLWLFVKIFGEPPEYTLYNNYERHRPPIRVETVETEFTFEHSGEDQDPYERGLNDEEARGIRHL